MGIVHVAVHRRHVGEDLAQFRDLPIPFGPALVRLHQKTATAIGGIDMLLAEPFAQLPRHVSGD